MPVINPTPIQQPHVSFVASSNRTRPELDISVIVPVYNSAHTLATLLGRLAKVKSPLTQSYEVIRVDDGSRDTSWQVIQGLRETYGSHVVAVQLLRKYGQHNTLMCGLGLMRGEYVATMDGDLRNPPEETPSCWSTLSSMACSWFTAARSPATMRHGAILAPTSCGIFTALFSATRLHPHHFASCGTSWRKAVGI